MEKTCWHREQCSGAVAWMHCSNENCKERFGESPPWEHWPNSGPRYGVWWSFPGFLRPFKAKSRALHPPPPVLEGQGCCVTAEQDRLEIKTKDYF